MQVACFIGTVLVFQQTFERKQDRPCFPYLLRQRILLT